MSENMKRFLELVSKDENLKKKVMELEKMEADKALQETIAFAKELGIELTEADFAKEKLSGELSDDELDAVAGGGGCGCAFGGGGSVKFRGEDVACVCVGGGAGEDKCLCILAGAGED